MDFEKNVPEWNAKGTEPPESLKTTGFEAGYKPPAAFFNWFWNRVSACLKEIQAKLKGHAEDKTNPHGVTAAQLGLGKVNNTSDSEKAVAFAQEAGVARKAQSSMIIRFGGGKTENTDQWTYDGSTGRSVNITADKIGAAEKGLSNVADSTFAAKASASGAYRLPVVPATSADGVAYTATVDGVTELYNGLMITIVPEVASTSTAVTLNVNNTGAKILRLPLSFNNAAMTAPRDAAFFTAGRPITVQYDANYATGGAWKTIGKQKTSAQDLYGTVPLESGGTGAETAKGAEYNIFSAIGGTTDPVVDSINFVCARSKPSATLGVFYNRTAANLWEYIAGKIRSTFGFTSANVLPVANGGTGNTTGLAASATKLATARTVQTNLSSTATASFDGSANITPGVTGTLPIANGGTGASTAADARTSLGITPANIGAVTKSTASASLSASSWSGSGPYTQTVSVSGVTTSNTVIVAPAYASQEKYNDCGVGASAQAAGKLTFTAQSKPDAALTVNVLILN